MVDGPKTVELTFMGCNVLYSVVQSLLLGINSAQEDTNAMDVLFILYEIIIGLCYSGCFSHIYFSDESSFLFFSIMVENITHFVLGFLFSLNLNVDPYDINPYKIAIVTLYVAKFVITYITIGCVYSYLNRKVAPKNLVQYSKQIEYNLSFDSCTICLDEFDNKEKIGQLPCGHYFHIICLKSWKPTILICPICSQSVLSAKNYHTCDV